MVIPNKLKKGDTIGVVAPSNPIVGDNVEEIMMYFYRNDKILLCLNL